MISTLIRHRERFGIAGLFTKVYRSKGGLWFPEYDHVLDRRRNVLAILRRPGGALLIPGSNIVTVAGNTYFAQRSCGTTPTNAFGIWELGSAGTPGASANRSAFTAIASTQQAVDATYPQTSDPDTDNAAGAGATVRTSRVSYTAASFNNGAITHGWLTNTSPGASEPLLANWAWAAAINKTASDTLKCFHNATCLGV